MGQGLVVRHIEDLDFREREGVAAVFRVESPVRPVHSLLRIPCPKWGPEAGSSGPCPKGVSRQCVHMN
jgi:hypothetical protein